MKRLFPIVAALSALLTAPFLSEAQTTDTDALLRSDITLTHGEYCMYDFDVPEPSKAPKGYKPFYISHYGRHGSRYALSDKVYEWVDEVLATAHDEGHLTPEGERLYGNYKDFYPHVAHRGGELTQKGQEQHRRLACIMYDDYKEVFKGQTHVEAVSTAIPRVILSMMSFLGGLDDLDRTIDFSYDEGLIYYQVLLPAAKENPRYRKGNAEMDAEDGDPYFNEMLDPRKFTSRFFSDPDWLEEKYGMWKFENNLRTIVVDISSLDYEPEYRFDDVFTDEELIGIWKYRNYGGYKVMGRYPKGGNGACMAAYGTVEDILEKAEKDIADGSTQLRLRFGHDSGILPLLAFMKVGTFGIESLDKVEIANNFRSFDIPMAANLQLVFYRSRRNPEILVKPVLNGVETTLPLEPVEGSYYKWSDFKAYYTALCKEADAWLDAE